MKIKFKRATVNDAKTIINIRNLCFYTDFIKYGECPAYNNSIESISVQLQIELYIK